MKYDIIVKVCRILCIIFMVVWINSLYRFYDNVIKWGLYEICCFSVVVNRLLVMYIVLIFEIVFM